ncbi:MAG: M24 family metallopeptidase [Candidatus Geothermincolia bacterium]
MSDARVSAVRSSMISKELHSLVVTKRENVFYLSGFTGDSCIAVVTDNSLTLVTDGRFREQATREASGWDVLIYERNIFKAIAGCLGSAMPFGIEDSSSVRFYERLAAEVERSHLTQTDGIVEDLRVTKDKCEITAVRAAVDCALHAWETLLPMLQPGVTERQLAAGLDYRMMTAGADRPAFDTIVASGPNASMPHAGITDRILEDGDQVIVDFGAMKDGYCCDITRTIALGEPSPRAAEVAGAVRGAWDAAFAVISPGVKASEVDAAARGYLENAGLAKEFVHGLGHGVGLEVHEKPSVSGVSVETLEPGMVFTIEPGVYIEGETGARHEELVLLTADGAEALSANANRHSPRQGHQGE